MQLRQFEHFDQQRLETIKNPHNVSGTLWGISLLSLQVWFFSHSVAQWA